MNIKEKTKKLLENIPALFLALKDTKTPVIAKLMALLTVCYALSPIDLIPDFIPVLGYLDDLIILPFLIGITIKLIPAEQFEKCKEASKDIYKDGVPEHWYYAIPIVLIWILTIWVILK